MIDMYINLMANGVPSAKAALPDKETEWDDREDEDNEIDQ